jgi:hypothetical protein
VKLFKQHKVKASVVPGGTLARELVKSRNPKAIVAIACERELWSGIRDTQPVPVISIINERPNGPCVETKAPCQLVDDALSRLLCQDSRTEAAQTDSTSRQNTPNEQPQSENTYGSI